MKKYCIHFLVLFFATVCTCSGQIENRTKLSYRKGLAIVSTGFEAMGGKKMLDKIGHVSFTLTGKYYARHQSYLPDMPFDSFPIETRVIYQLKNECVLWEQRNGLRDGTFFSTRLFANKEGGYNLVYNRESYTSLPPNSPVLQLANRILPVFFLDKVLAQKESIRSLGEVMIGGKKLSVVSFYLDSQLFTAYFDAGSKWLTKYELLVPDATAGDYLVEFNFFNYRSFDGLFLPTRFTESGDGKIVEESGYSDLRFNHKQDTTVFKLPDGYPLFRPSPFAIRSLANDVFLAEGLLGSRYRCLIVALDDGIMVVDAPGNSHVTAALIAQVKQLIPDKPIKYLVATHHHDDHTGGTRSFIAEGATIITTKRNKNFFEQMAKAAYTLEPDALSRQVKKPDFLFIEKSQQFRYRGGTVEIHKLEKNSHAKDIYIVYLPNEKLIFQSDLYNLPINGANKATMEFIEEITPLGWQVETVIGSHSGAVPFQQIRKEASEFKVR